MTYGNGVVMGTQPTAGLKGRKTMEVRLADHFGMCFGVRDAIDLALGLARAQPVTVLGELVHNEEVVRGLEAAGHNPGAIQLEGHRRGGEAHRAVAG